MDAGMDVLVADDDEISRLKTTRTLHQWGYNVIEATDGDEALQIMLQPDAPRLVIVDWMMPKMSGIELCRAIRETETDKPYTYILLLTGRSSKDDLIEALSAGADDFINKPFDIDILRARILVGVRILTLHSRLHHTATHDALTGLLNRGAILELLKKSFARAERTEEHLCVILIDLDFFKSVNDTYGHLAGDSVLKQVGARLLSCVRGYDEVGRYGGEEFIIVVHGIPLENAASLAERIRSKFEEEPIFFNDSHLIVTLSLGLSQYDKTTHEGIEQLLHQADIALYKAKDSGRNRVVIYDHIES